jgi:CRP/FNR family cyclic AMP-dependent transcriptional regulator
MTIKRRRSFNPKSLLAKVGDRGSVVRYCKGQIVFSQGDRANAVFYLQSGNVKSTITTNSGKKAVVAIHSATEFFGETCLAGHARRISTAESLTDSVVLRLELKGIHSLIHQEPTFADMFIGGLLDRNIRIEADLTDQLCNSSERRLARLLLLLANFGKKNGKPKSIVANISQETLAAMVGTTRSRVSYFMNKFRKQGLIDYNGTIKVHGFLLKSALDDQLNV